MRMWLVYNQQAVTTKTGCEPYAYSLTSLETKELLNNTDPVF